jgi:hypothetical protein
MGDISPGTSPESGQMTLLADLAANVLAVIHLAFFLFIVGGMAAIILGPSRGLAWVRNPWFRVAHLLAIYLVLAEDVIGFQCPLNVLQWDARTAATGSAETNAGLGGLLDFLLYHTISGQVLKVMYACFGVIVLALFWIVPPRWKHRTAPVRSSPMVER